MALPIDLKCQDWQYHSYYSFHQKTTQCTYHLCDHNTVRLQDFIADITLIQRSMPDAAVTVHAEEYSGSLEITLDRPATKAEIDAYEAEQARHAAAGLVKERKNYERLKAMFEGEG